MRLDKLLVQRGIGSRSVVHRLLRRRRVTLDGDVVTDPRHTVTPDVQVVVDGEVSDPPPRLVAWHKPIGVLCTVADPWGREGLEGVLPPAWGAALHPVGRLDKDTSGLLLFSSDGALTQHLLHPKRALPRTYVATLQAAPGPDLGDRLAHGVPTAAGTFTATLDHVDGRTVCVTVREGKHRMVRRMLANAGVPVETLHRVAYAGIELGDLAVGELRRVSADELAVAAPTKA